MKLKDFYFDLPEDRIAHFPSEKRDESKLMLVDRKTGIISHHRFKDIVELTGPDDFFVVNNSKVIPVRLFGRIDHNKVEMLVVKIIGEHEVEAFTLPAKRFKPGQKIFFANVDGRNGGKGEDGELWAEVTGMGHRGRRFLKFHSPVNSVLKAGYAPLPPYIKRKFEEAVQYRLLDLERYQTVYSKTPGSIAAPTAGLHFTQGIIEQIRERSEIVEITLEVGETTFRKIEVEDISFHRMGREWITISETDRKNILELKKKKHLIAVGTTSVRSLETWALNSPLEETFYSELFISPGFEFKMIDKLITNFHLPESSLFILVSAFAGIDLMKKAYHVAIEQGYRFFSYGDAMFIR